jgi:TRAP transporter TAXI family solute receptor
VLYPNYTHLASIKGKNIDRIADLRGRVVSTGSPGSGTEVIALRVLRAAGIDPEHDIRKQSLSVNASVDALKDGKIDAFFWSGGLPTASLLDLASSVNITATLIPNDDVLPVLQSTYASGLYFRLVIPADAYPGVASEIGVVGVANALVVEDKMSNDLAYELTKALFEHQSDLAAIHPEANNLSLASATLGSPTPFHPGAIRYYQERGAWK